MILKIDHLAFSSLNFEDDLKTFSAIGYNIYFVEKGLRDLENKRDLMKDYSGYLDMALMNRKGSISIELLNHGHVVDEDSYVLPILEGTRIDTEIIDDVMTINGCSFVKAKSNYLKAGFFIAEKDNATEFCCNKLIVDADNVEKAAAFWCCLGFKPASVGPALANLEFKTPFSDERFQLYIRRKVLGAKKFILDSHGFNCIAFFSTDAEKDRKRFAKLGLEPTEDNLFRVNGKDLSIFWLLGPCGEIVEVISLAK
ncbi:MAG: hypothetical protein ACLP9S_15345 [Syntrophales bacterium]